MNRESVNNIQKQSNLVQNDNQFTAYDLNNQFHFNVGKSGLNENANLYSNDHNIIDLTQICHLIGNINSISS
jgi:hypothetical protein